MSSTRTRSWWGWGWTDAAVDSGQRDRMAETLASRFGVASMPRTEAVQLSAITLRSPRVQAPGSLGDRCSTATDVRAGHTYGRSYADVVHGFHGEFPEPPDLVAFPETEADIVALLDWASSADVAVIPYGGGSSVVGGVSTDVPGHAGVVSLDMSRFDRVLDIDRISRAARIQAGAMGPALEAQLKPHGYTLRHFPQSFEHSTLGGWLATRSGGHYATVYTHIDDLVESLRVVTPRGVSESFRLPGSGAGPSPDRMFLGSEGILGIITEAWMRVQDRPTHKASAAVHFTTFEAGAEAVRALSQSALFPTNCRLLDPNEAASAAGVIDGSAVLVLGFESAHHPVNHWLDLAITSCRDHGGRFEERPEREREHGREPGATADGAVEAWRNAFLRAPYGRDALVSMSVIAETFETACTWDRFPALHADAIAAVERALRDVCGGGSVTCRFTHVYPDGPAPYFSILAPGRPGSEIAQWNEIKAAASEVLVAHGATITHHHAVGRDHRPWYDRQRPAPFAAALVAAKQTLDPAGVLNPGVLIDPA